MDIKVLGSGCAGCKTTLALIERNAKTRRCTAQATAPVISGLLHRRLKP